MTATEIHFIDKITHLDTDRFSSRREWLTKVIDPAFDRLQHDYDQTIKKLEVIYDCLKEGDIAVASQRWNSVLATHRRLAKSLQQLIQFVSLCAYDDIVSFTMKLQLFFQVDDKTSVSSNEFNSRALLPYLDQAVTDYDSGNRIHTMETIEAELLHIRLKWTILQNNCITLQVGDYVGDQDTNA